MFKFNKKYTRLNSRLSSGVFVIECDQEFAHKARKTILDVKATLAKRFPHFNPLSPTPQNGQTHSNNLSVTVEELF